jgi:membrane-bound lytic murein transglycosylase F
LDISAHIPILTAMKNLWGLVLIATFVATLGLAGCGERQPQIEPEVALAAALEEGRLIVLTASGPTSHFIDDDGRVSGYEVELAEAFAQSQGLTVEFDVRDNLQDVLAAIEAGEGHIAAAGITVTNARAERFDFGPAYKAVTEQLVCRRAGARVREVSDMAGVSISVVAGSSYAETLAGLQASVPDIEFQEVEAPSAMPLLRRVQNERLDCTVADSNLIAHARLQYPELLTPLTLSEERSHGWVIAAQAPQLAQTVDAWFDQAHDNGVLADLDERWYGYTRRFDYVDVARFVRRVDERLPSLRRHFVAAAIETGIDWRWLAAQAYQESHWDRDAVSATGVRGIMMLTLPTANEVGVEDRTDPRQSIHGGATYLRRLFDRMPEGVDGEDQLFKAFAAYNVGMGHLYDARRLARRQNLDPDVWPSLRRTLPLLSEREYYSTVPYGYARGHEPVQYVRNIRRYRALLDLHVNDVGPLAARVDPTLAEDPDTSEG